MFREFEMAFPNDDESTRVLVDLTAVRFVTTYQDPGNVTLWFKGSRDPLTIKFNFNELAALLYSLNKQ